MMNDSPVVFHSYYAMFLMYLCPDSCDDENCFWHLKLVTMMFVVQVFI